MSSSFLYSPVSGKRTPHLAAHDLRNAVVSCRLDNRQYELILQFNYDVVMLSKNEFGGLSSSRVDFRDINGKNKKKDVA